MRDDLRRRLHALGVPGVEPPEPSAARANDTQSSSAPTEATGSRAAAAPVGSTAQEPPGPAAPPQLHQRDPGAPLPDFPAGDPGEYFDAWLASSPTLATRAETAHRDRERAAAEVARSRNALASTLSTALARFGGDSDGVELEPPLEAPNQGEQHRRRRVVAEEVHPGKVLRTELASKLNQGHDASVTRHIETCRQHLEDEEAREATSNGKLAPNRRERPVAKEDVQRTSVHREARIMAAAIVNSKGAHVIQSYLRRLRPIFSGQPLAALREAALSPQPTGGFRWTYADECARRRIAIGLMWLVIGRWTNQRTAFGSRSTRRGLLVAGLSVDRILRAVTPVGRRAYDRHVFGSRVHDNWQGDMAHFERAGFALRKRLPPTRVNAWEVGPSGQAKNRYWIGCVVSQRKRPTERQRRAGTNLAGLGAVVGEIAFSVEAHELGWQWCEEPVAYAKPLEAPS